MVAATKVSMSVTRRTVRPHLLEFFPRDFAEQQKLWSGVVGLTKEG